MHAEFWRGNLSPFFLKMETEVGRRVLGCEDEVWMDPTQDRNGGCGIIMLISIAIVFK